MVNVIGVRFQNAGKLYFFDPGAFWPTPGDFVIVETARGIEFGEVVTPVREINDEQLASPLKQVVRIATAQDVQHAQENKQNEKEAYAICQKKIGEHKLDMKLVSVEYTFDNSKILFYFTANGRVDFRSLVKDLAAVFKTRIELRQIGVRDEAKMLGGLGPCGRPVCCGAFLGDFQPVSIKMAKEQNLSLNPTKISGVCGRLMCCLKYEQDNYEQTRKRMPKVGKEVITPDGNGVVWDLNIIKETVRVRIQKGDSSELKDFPLEEVQRVGAPAQQPAKKEAAPAVEEPAAEAETAVEVSEEKPAEEQHHDEPKRERPRDKQLGKPVQRENPNRKDKQEGENHDRRQRKERGNQPKQDKPAEAPAAKPEAPKPAVSSWKQAVEAALKAAQEEKK
ncbi:MAG: stage 0 sporulation family protein [Clostridia bacterium]|nr:stage 0 sporulation family protein [Clostridia bacterium]